MREETRAMKARASNQDLYWNDGDILSLLRLEAKGYCRDNIAYALRRTVPACNTMLSKIACGKEPRAAKLMKERHVSFRMRNGSTIIGSTAATFTTKLN